MSKVAMLLFCATAVILFAGTKIASFCGNIMIVHCVPSVQAQTQKNFQNIGIKGQVLMI